MNCEIDTLYCICTAISPTASYSSLMLQEGIHPKIVQERLGHSRVSLTLDIYSHVLPVMQQEAAIKLDELLTPIAVDLQYFEK